MLFRFLCLAGFTSVAPSLGHSGPTDWLHKTLKDFWECKPPNKPNVSLLAELREAEEKNDVATAKLIADTIRERVKKDEGWFRREYRRLDVSIWDIPLELLHKTGSNLNYYALLRTRTKIKPSNFSSFQDRQDRFEFESAVSFPVSDFGVSGRILLNTEFSRLFEIGDKLKLHKVALPPCVPTEYSQVAKVLTPGDAVRVQMHLMGNIGQSNIISEDDGEYQIRASAPGFSRSASLYVDIYKLERDKVQVRVSAVKTPLMVGANLQMLPWITGSFALTGGFSLLTRWLNRQITSYLRMEPFSFGYSRTVSDELRIQTNLGSYDFDLKNPAAQRAYDEALDRVLSRGTVLELAKALNQEDLGDALRTRLANSLDTQHDKDLAETSVEKKQDGVFRNFQGQMLTNLRSFVSNSKIFGRWLFRYDFSHSLADSDLNVKSSGPSFSDFKFVSSNRILNYRYLLNLRGCDGSRQVNALFTANNVTDPKAGRKIVELVPKELTNVIFRGDFFCKKMDAETVEIYKERFEHLHPSWGYNIPWKEFLKNPDKVNAFIRYEYVFNVNSLANLPALDETFIYERLRSILQNFPYVGELLTSYQTPAKDLTRDEAFPPSFPYFKDELKPVLRGVYVRDLNKIVSRVVFDKFETDIRHISKLLEKLTKARYVPDPSEPLDVQTQKLQASAVERYELFKSLTTINLFYELGPALWLSLLPQHNLNKYVQFMINYGDEEFPGETRFFPEQYTPVTPIYANLQGQLAILSTRDFDIRTRADALGFIRTEKFDPNKGINTPK